MLSIFKSWVFVLCIFSMPVILAQEYTILPSSNLYIKGSTNINNFTCNFNMDDIRPANFGFSSSAESFKSVFVEFPVASFDCGGAGINKDFRNLLKESYHPLLQIRLLDIKPITESKAKISLEFVIAGVNNSYEVVVNYKKEGDYLHTQGSFQLDIENYGLEQPRRMLGLVVVRKEIDVHFAIDFI